MNKTAYYPKHYLPYLEVETGKVKKGAGIAFMRLNNLHNHLKIGGHNNLDL